MKSISLVHSPELLFRAACELGAATEMVTRNVAAFSAQYLSNQEPARMHGEDGADVLFVHGLLGNHSWSLPLARRLETLGHRTQSLDYRSVGVDLREASESVAAIIDAYVPAGRQVHVVAHSLGGLVIRSVAAQHGLGDRFASVTTLATPHNGTPMAMRSIMQLPGVGRLIRDLHPGSKALQQLANAEASGPASRCVWTALYSHHDEMVPAESGRLVSDHLDASNVLLNGLGHFSIATDPRVQDVIAELFTGWQAANEAFPTSAAA